MLIKRFNQDRATNKRIRTERASSVQNVTVVRFLHDLSGRANWKNWVS